MTPNYKYLENIETKEERGKGRLEGTEKGRKRVGRRKRERLDRDAPKTFQSFLL